MFTVGGLILGPPDLFIGLLRPGLSIGGSATGGGADMTGISSAAGAGGGGGGAGDASGGDAPVSGIAITG